MKSLRTALNLLTTLSFHPPEDWQPGDSGRAALWFPLIGLLIGGLSWLTWSVSARIFPPLVTGILTLGVWVALTGGLHLDGLADCCDGLLVVASPTRRLEIMKDPHLGAFGVIGLTLILMLKAAALSSFSPAASAGICLAASLGRWCILPAGLLPSAHPEGMGADFVSGLQRRSLLLAAILPLGLAVILGTTAVVATLAGLLAAAAILALAKARIGGVTGDVFGCVVEIVETVVLLVFAAQGFGVIQ
jgi:adenosylcobinamide-GDP ribazoletransferase